MSWFNLHNYYTRYNHISQKNSFQLYSLHLWNSIRVEHRNQNENKILSQKMSSHFSFVQKEFNDSSYGIAWRSLIGMYSGWNKYYGLISWKFDYFLVAKGKSFSYLKPFLQPVYPPISTSIALSILEVWLIENVAGLTLLFNYI